MTPLPRTLLHAAVLTLFVVALAAMPAWAQRRPKSPPDGGPGRSAARPPNGAAGRTPSPAPTQPAPVPPQAPEGQLVKPDCEQVRRNARFNVYFDKVEIEKLVQTVSDATCKTFILPENVRGRISIIGPENGKVEVNADQFYAAFLAALDANNLAVYPQGKFLKIVDKPRAKQNPIPTVLDGEPYTLNEQMVTRIFKVNYVEVEQLRGVLQQLVSQGGDTIPFQPDTIIVNDVASNIHRLEKIVAQLDRRSASDEVRLVQVQYATAQEIADKIQKLFESKNQKPGQRPGAIAAPPPGSAPTPPPGTPGGAGGEAGQGVATLTQLIPDERTNKLIIVASPAAFQRIDELIKMLDVPVADGGRINVYYLENANADEIASTLQSLSQGGGSRPGTPRPTPPPGGAVPAAGSTSAELFSGEVKISADKGTNSLVIIASQSDYRNIVRVIEKLDIPRRQVFVEAVLMEVNLDRNSEFGLNLHTGYSLSTPQGEAPGLAGTSFRQGSLPPSLSLANLASFGGFLAGLQGPIIPELSKLGVDIPAFGIVLHALQQSSDVNVLSTPHILTSDNEEAEIAVGQNVPFQAGFSPGNVSGLASAAGVAGAAGVSSLATGFTGLGSLFAPIQRQNVELKLTIKPQINESDYIRMVINEQTEEIASQDPVLGPTTAKRSAKTTVVAKDQETVVIGGIMQDRVVESVSKVPILGDIPILGHLFREQTRRKVKTNLLLFLTPYIIKDSSDFHHIFARKMRERQDFVEQFYGQVPGYDVPVDFSRKAGPLTSMTRTATQEAQKFENGGEGGTNEKLFRPSGETPPPPPASPSAPPSPKSEGPATPKGSTPSPAPAQAAPPAESTPAPAPPPESIEVQPTLQ